jgi:DNA-binding NarL/FixJ family response regulator
MGFMEFDAPLRVFIVADHPLARVGLAALLREQPMPQDMPLCEVVGQGADDDTLPQVLNVYQPQVILWDMAWQNVEDSPSLAEVVEFNYPLVVLVNERSQANALWQLGVRGLLYQNTDVNRINAALLGASQALAVIDQALIGEINLENESFALRSLPEPLTPRELEVLQALAEGKSNKAIAYSLGISDHTVKFHVTAIMNKLHAQSRTEAVVKATRLGLIHL